MAGLGFGGGGGGLNVNSLVTPPFTGGVQRTLGSKIFETVSVTDFGALGDGSGDTIAEWLTGGSHDRGYADLAAIQVDYPEANNLANTIDQVAHWTAFKYAIANGLTAWTPDGEYIFARHLFTLTIDNSFIWHLAPRAVIKRAPRTMTSTWDRMLTIAASVNLESIEIDSGVFDGNAENNPPAWSASEAVEVGNLRRAVDDTILADRVYTCTVAGTTAGSGSGPQGTGTAIADGTAEWNFVIDTAVWYGWEQSALVFVNVSNVNVKNVSFRNSKINDRTADGFAVFTGASATSRVDYVTFENITNVSAINRQRADVIWYENVRHVRVAGCDLYRIEAEYDNAPYLQRQEIKIADTTCNILDILTHDAGYSTLYLSNVISKDQTYFAYCNVRAVNSELAGRPDTTAMFYRMRRAFLHNCIMRPLPRFDIADAGGNLLSISGLPDTANSRSLMIHFDSCHFERRMVNIGTFTTLAGLYAVKPAATGGDYATVGGTVYAWDPINRYWRTTSSATFNITGNALRSELVATSANVSLMTTIARKCTFEPELSRCVLINGNGTWRLIENSYSYAIQPFYISQGGDSRAIDVTIAGGSYLGPGVQDMLLASFNADANNVIRVTGHWDRSTFNFTQIASTWTNARFTSNRYRYSTTAPTHGGVVGDRVVLLPSVGGGALTGAVEYTCTVSHPTAATWAASKWAPQATTHSAAAGDGNATLVTGMEFGKRYAVRIQETTPMDGSPKTFRLGTSAGDDSILGDVTATGTAEAIVYVDGAGQNIVLSWVNTAGTAGVLTSTVKVMG